MKPCTLTSIILLLIASYSCTSSTESKTPALKLNAEELIEARALFQTHCYACHTPGGNHDDRIAPPMVAIKQHYINENTTQEQFVSAISTFIANPSTEISKMPGAIMKHGMMVPLKVPKEDLTKIASFIYQQELEAPEWFDERHGKGKRKRGNHDH